MDQLELSKLLLEEFKYINALFWKVLFASIIVVVSLLTVPFLKIEADSGDLLRKLAYVFPLSGCLFAIGATWILHTLHGRFRLPGDLYRELLRARLRDIGLEDRYKITDPLQIPGVGQVAYLAFLVIGFGASLAALLLIWTS